MNLQRAAVTGAFGYTGKYMARKLLKQGWQVVTLTGHPERPNPFDGKLEARPYCFEDPAAMVESLKGARVLFNTYWVRFPYGRVAYQAAVQNSRTLFQAAKEAGVQRVVHVSIANPSPNSPLAYYRGKWELEQALMQTGLSYAILRPTVIFGPEDILINNIAWFVRRFPFFAVPGDGQYRLQPIFVEDFAELAVQLGESRENTILDAVGPEVYTFNQLIHQIAITVHKKPRLVHVPPGLALLLTRLVGLLMRDVILTRDEVLGLMADLLVTPSPPSGKAHLSSWLDTHGQTVGMNYASELDRHYR